MAIKARDVKENVSMVDLLYNLGYSPVKKTGKERLYLSMLRDSDSTPSFSVDDKKGTWFDHGEGKGGNIIDFGLLYWKGLSFQEVLEKIVAVTNSEHRLESPVTQKGANLRQPVEPNYHIVKIKELGNNAAITGYLQNRGIWQTSLGRLKEVYYFVEDEQKNRKNFFAAGWQNENCSWEIRSTEDFKGCLGHKAISFIPGDKHSLAVFEGFMDYLSWLSDNPFATNSVLVLNSLSLLQAGITKAKGFSVVSTYFDNDSTGKKATATFKAAIPQAIDRSAIYEGYNDYNDKTVAELNQFNLNR